MPLYDFDTFEGTLEEHYKQIILGVGPQTTILKTKACIICKKVGHLSKDCFFGNKKRKIGGKNNKRFKKSKNQ